MQRSSVLAFASALAPTQGCAPAAAKDSDFAKPAMHSPQGGIDRVNIGAQVFRVDRVGIER
jgi:hypothetical protein